MKILVSQLFALVVLSFASIATIAQVSPGCPKLVVVGPSTLTMPGELAVFSLDLDPFKWDNLKFKWEVNLGTIEEGQGTSKISVRADTDKLFSSITATVAVTGLPEGCPSIASETAGVAGIGDVFPIDEWGRLSGRDELGRLDVAATEWLQKPSNILYFIIYVAKSETTSSERTRIKRITDHLTKTRKIPRENVVIMKSGNAPARRTTIYLLPIGADPPQP